MTKPQELVKGVQFTTDRDEEGVVTVMCDYGKCKHDPSRTESVHVQGTYYSKLFDTLDTTQFFVNLPSNYPIEEWGAEMVKQ